MVEIFFFISGPAYTGIRESTGNDLNLNPTLIQKRRTVQYILPRVIQLVYINKQGRSELKYFQKQFVFQYPPTHHQAHEPRPTYRL